MSIEGNELPVLNDRLSRFLAQDVPEGRFAIGKLAPAAKGAIRTETDLVLIDRCFVEHQRKRHSEVSLAAYGMIGEVLANPTVVLQQTGERLLMLKRCGRIYVLAVKSTANREEN